MTTAIVRCLNCRRLFATASLKPRGLCRPCYQIKDIREDYAYRRRGGWHRTARTWDLDEKALLMELYEHGLSDKEIGRQLDRSEGSVQKQRQRLGLPVDRKRQGTHRTREYLRRNAVNSAA